MRVEVGDVLRVRSDTYNRYAGLVGQVTAISESRYRYRMQFFCHKARPWIEWTNVEPASDLEALACLVQLKE